MHTHAGKKQATKNTAETGLLQRQKSSAYQFMDNRPEAAAQRKIQEIADNSMRAIPRQQQVVQKQPIVQLVKTDQNIQTFDNKHEQVSYDPDKKLSEGADGTVHIGEMNGRKVIVKVAKAGSAGSIKNEINVFKKMAKNQHIIGALGYSADETILVLEKADTSLNKSLPKKTDDRMRLAAGTGKGLQSMHEQNITHGDLNLKNILSDKGTARLTDFGSSIPFGDEDSIQKPVPEGFEDMIMPDDPQLNVQKSVTIAADLKDFMKVATNILLGNKDNTHPTAASFKTLENDLLVKGVPGVSVKPIMRIVQKANPTQQDLSQFVEAIELTLEREKLKQILSEIPTGGRDRKKVRLYKTQHDKIQQEIGSIRKKLEALEN